MRRAILLPFLSLAVLGAAEDYSAVAPVNQRPMLGVEMTPPTTAIQDREGLDPHQGVQVQSTYDSTAAADMGLHKDDVILAVNGQPITSMTDLRNEVGLTAIGDQIDVQVSRNGQLSTVTANVKPWPDNIPYQKLDSEAEKRFRDWQDRRQQRLADDVARMANETEKLRRDLTGEDDERGADAAVAPQADADQLAFRFRYQLSSARLPVAAPPQPILLAAADLPEPPVQGPWRVTVTLPSLATPAEPLVY